ncbi:FlgD immunoglobulin-like domain containing protein [Mucilaginibacter polytrichastri]|uniref:FlgD/Vpr Ig-like domain-containing protein n=1 Tax=Mucilaginibacter polytrichastri TaxID=1302689 RepID=A0A1Q5ZU00_9SPHI|nr:FlgD immunoglobulin-like domain containing protein [Mucilaginibacter polytrichastri]OKS85158.1 hypothetical protein RG47T_0602 [Mucilaginibacter polytrichastri]SFS43556.1 FlgD Ig-like domain-containing protein [Mucilaginibacter polytrichastri]
MKYKKIVLTKPSRYLFYIVALVIIILLKPKESLAQQPNADKAFTFTLNTTAKTSAGIFTKDGTLIKTLWSGTVYNSGTHSATWDGTDDESKPVSPGAYLVKVLSNNVKYTWEGVIGNTSDSLSGPSVYHSIEPLYGMAIFNDYAYFVTNYNEQSTSTFKFNLKAPEKSIAVLSKGIAAKFVTTDGINVYWGGKDANTPGNWFVYATKTIDDYETIFDFGQPVKTKYARAYKSVLDFSPEATADITGLAVQKAGKYLLVAHQKLNTINVINKKNGETVKKIAFNSPGILTIDKNDDLWIVSTSDEKSTINKYKITSTGDLVPLNLKITDIQFPLAMAISPDNATILVADGNNSQQVKAFNNQNGLFKWVYGQQGGYTNSPDVADTKFYFGDMRNPQHTTIAYQPDGSFWIEDSGNCRTQHYDANLKFINRIMYLNSSYSTGVDPNKPDRVFADYLEFKVDYTKTLKGNNNSWTLIKNWGYNIPPKLDSRYIRLHFVTTLKNGRTYTQFYNNETTKWIIGELTYDKGIRLTNAIFDNNKTQFYPDGSLRRKTVIKLGQSVTWSIRPLISFDANNDPIWGAEKTIATYPSATSTDPLKDANFNLYHAADITSSNILVSYDNVRADLVNTTWHLGGIRLGDHKWLWKTAKATSSDYKGAYPPDGMYDYRKLSYGGSISLVMDKNIFWGYYGEGWNGGEVNKWNHVYDDGLFIGQLGVAGKEIKNTEAPPMMAGNAFSAVLVKTKGVLYLYHNDESQHGGIHRWKITNLNTIQEQSIPIRL